MTAAILAGTIPTLSALRRSRDHQFINNLPRRLFSFPVGTMGTMAEIIELRPRETGLDDRIFNAACEMLEDLRAIEGTMARSPHANAVNGLIGKSSTASSAQRDAAF
jgi:hypothetical protein